MFVVKIVEKEGRWEANLVNETTGSVRAFSALMENVYLFVVSCQIFNVVFVAGVCCCCCCFLFLVCVFVAWRIRFVTFWL